ncbi:MAG: hypothetical protein QY325_15665 [Flavobacteriales bacterium]|nr:MAG: hypothetical protein QY325_15665 [Flavobacteriales bacterium]
MSMTGSGREDTRPFACGREGSSTAVEKVSADKGKPLVEIHCPVAAELHGFGAGPIALGAEPLNAQEADPAGAGSPNDVCGARTCIASSRFDPCEWGGLADDAIGDAPFQDELVMAPRLIMQRHGAHRRERKECSVPDGRAEPHRWTRTDDTPLG